MDPDSSPRHTHIVVGIIVFLILFSFAPTMYEWNARGRTKPDRFFELVHNFPTDYNLYLSKIRQGKEGSWLAKEKYTSEPHSGSLSQILYVIIGRLADYAHIQTPYVWFAYHVARLFFSGVFLWSIWKLSEWLMRSQGYGYQLLVFLLIALQSTWPKFETILGVPRLGGWMPWYTQADSLQRTTFMPHVLLAQTLMIFIFWVFSTMQFGTGGFITRKHPGNAIFLGVVGLILGIVFPPGLTFVYGVIAFVCVSEMIALFTRVGARKTRVGAILGKWFVSVGYDRFIFGIISMPSLVYFALLLSQYPWKRLVEFDVLHPTKFSFVEYFMAVGPLFPLGLLGILFVIFFKKELMGKLQFFLYWTIGWLIFLFVFDKIPQQSPTRFTQMVPQVPLGVFTGVLLYELITITKAALAKLSHRASKQETDGTAVMNLFLLRGLYYSVFALPIVIIVLSLSSMASSYMWLRDFVDHKLRATIPLVPHNADVMYPMREIVEGLIWLQVNTPRSAIVLTGKTTGNYMPVYSGNTAYIGHANTVKLEIKEAEIGNFYRRHLPLEEEMEFLNNSRASYVFYGPEEFEISGGVEDLRTLYPALVQVYQSPMVRIYKTPQN